MAPLVLFAASCASHRGAPEPRPVVRVDPPPAAPPAAVAPASRPAFARLLELYDRDGDGRITSLEYPRGDLAFRNLDRNHDGAITQADSQVQVGMPSDLAAPFLLVMRLAGPDAESLAIGDLPEAFESVDENHDGAIDRAEFTGPESRPGSDRFAPVLAAADADRDGKLTLAELQDWAKLRDRDQDGRLSRRERTRPGREPPVGWFKPGEREKSPDFTLPRDEGAETVTLSSFAGKRPVALIFGSFT